LLLQPIDKRKKAYPLIAATGVGLLVLVGLLSLDKHRVFACTPTATPPAFVAPPTPSEMEQVATTTQNSDMVLKGTIIDVQYETWDTILIVEVSQYLKGKGTEIIRLRNQFYPCSYESMYIGTKGTFFIQRALSSNTPLHDLTYFESDKNVVNQVTKTVGAEAFQPEHSQSLPEATLLFLLGLGLIGLVLIRFRLSIYTKIFDAK
jgi:hypothetical protein